jgi:hypothetical protein
MILLFIIFLIGIVLFAIYFTCFLVDGINGLKLPICLLFHTKHWHSIAGYHFECDICNREWDEEP